MSDEEDEDEIDDEEDDDFDEEGEGEEGEDEEENGVPGKPVHGVSDATKPVPVSTTPLEPSHSLTPSQEQAPPKKKLKTAPAGDADVPQKNGAAKKAVATNGDEEEEEVELDEDEEFDEEEAEGEEEEEEEEEEGGEEEGPGDALPAKGVKVAGAPGAAEPASKAVAAGGDDED